MTTPTDDAPLESDAARRQRWEARYGLGGASVKPASSLVHLSGWLPPPGRAVDLAGGAGRHALWLARRGFAVTVVDRAEAGLQLAARRAAARGLEVTTQVRDLEAEGPPPGPWDLVLVHHYLDRPTLAGLAATLAPGGRALFVQPTARNLERHPRPSRRWLLDEGEAAGLFPGLEVLHLDESWAFGRHEARVVAERPGD